VASGKKKVLESLKRPSDNKKEGKEKFAEDCSDDIDLEGRESRVPFLNRDNAMRGQQAAKKGARTHSTGGGGNPTNRRPETKGSRQKVDKKKTREPGKKQPAFPCRRGGGNAKGTP